MGWMLLGAIAGLGLFFGRRRSARRSTALSVAEGRRRWEGVRF